MKKIQVLIVDDHALVRDGLKALLSTQKDIEVIGAASNGLEGIKEVKDKDPDVVLMDICMPGMSGLEALDELKKCSPKTKVIFLSMELCENSIISGFKNGMKGFLPKDLKKDRLIEAIRRVYAGEEYFDPRVSDVIFERSLQKPSQKNTTPTQNKRKGKILIEIVAILGIEIAAGMVLNFVGL